MPRQRITADQLPPPPDAGVQYATHEALVQCWEASLTEEIFDALEGASKKTYEATFDLYQEYVKRHGYKGPVNATTAGMFLRAKCEAIGSAASFSIWLSHIKTTGRKKGLLEKGSFNRDDSVFLAQLKRACGKKFGHVYTQAEEWGAEELKAFADRVQPSPSKDLKEYAIFVQVLLASASLCRPGDLCGKMCVVRVRHVQFIDASTELPYGGIRVTLDSSKAKRKTGRQRSEALLACGTGSSTCPVFHLKTFFNVYGLNSHLRRNEPLFAKLLKDGARASDTAGRPYIMTLAQYNSGLTSLCSKAKVPRVTAKGSRAGGRTDFGAAGVSDSVVTSLGRWSHFQSSRPYSRQATSLLHHLVKVLGIKKPSSLQQEAPVQDADQNWILQ